MRIGLVHTLAMEWAEYGIRVNSVSPGLVKTAMTYWVEQQPDWQEQLKYYRGIPRLAEVEELGGAYVYLLSDAAAYTTSIDIPVNGVIGSAFEYCRLIVVDLADENNSLLRGQGIQGMVALIAKMLFVDIMQQIFILRLPLSIQLVVPRSETELATLCAFDVHQLV